MKICGIISEYNPFHNGHAHHLKMSREISGCDYLICLMSGSFTQRGEPAIFDKWTRAQAAVMGGADLVIELPVLYALRSAEGFAAGAVKLLSALKAEMFSFGSETGDLASLEKIAEILNKEPRRFRTYLKENLSRGLSFPAAREQALSRYMDDARVSEFLTGSNAILGIEYLKANLSLNHRRMTPVIVKRKGSDYNDASLSDTFSSATAIRQSVLTDGLSKRVSGNVPPSAFKLYNDLIHDGYRPVGKEMFFDVLLYALRKCSAREIMGFPDVSEGLENRIKKAAANADTYEDLILMIKSKRFTYTRIQRILSYLLLGITDNMTAYADQNTPKSVKVLAYKKTADPLLSYLSKNAGVRLHHSSAGLDLDPFVRQDIRATDIHVLSQCEPAFRSCGLDFTTKTKTDI